MKYSRISIRPVSTKVMRAVIKQVYGSDFQWHDLGRSYINAMKSIKLNQGI